MEDYTHLVFLLDRSDSMSNIIDEARGGFNSMIEDQKANEGHCTVSTYLFDSQIDQIHSFHALDEIEPVGEDIWYPRGMTSLRDCIAHAVLTEKAAIEALPTEEQPRLVTMVVITDGEDTSSRGYTKQAIRELLTSLKSESWDVTFLGSTANAITQAEGLGISNTKAARFTAGSGIAAQSAFRKMSRYATSSRSLVAASASSDPLDLESITYSSEDREEMLKAE